MQPTKAPLAGYGYGLPLSRLYARYFHGDLILNSCEGYGTDAIVYLKTKESEADRQVPLMPLVFQGGSGRGRRYNLRKLGELPFHLIRCGKLEDLYRQVIYRCCHVVVEL